MKKVYILTVICKGVFDENYIISKQIGCYANKKSLLKAMDTIEVDIKSRDLANILWDEYFYERGVVIDANVIWRNDLHRDDFDVYEKYDAMFAGCRFDKFTIQQFDVVD